MERSKNSLKNIFSGLAIAASISGAYGQSARAQEIPVEPDGSSSTLEVNSSGNVLEENGFTLGSTPVEATPEATPVVVDLSETSEATLEQDVNGNYIFVQNDGTRIPVTRIDHVMIDNQLVAPDFGLYEFPITPPGNGGYLVSGVFQKYDIINHIFTDTNTNENVEVKIVRFWLNEIDENGNNLVFRTNYYTDDPTINYAISTDGASSLRIATLEEVISVLIPGQQVVLRVEKALDEEDLVSLFEQQVGECNQRCRNYREVYYNYLSSSETNSSLLMAKDYSSFEDGEIIDLGLASNIITGIPIN